MFRLLLELVVAARGENYHISRLSVNYMQAAAAESLTHAHMVLA